MWCKYNSGVYAVCGANDFMFGDEMYAVVSIVCGGWGYIVCGMFEEVSVYCVKCDVYTVFELDVVRVWIGLFVMCMLLCNYIWSV